MILRRGKIFAVTLGFAAVLTLGTWFVTARHRRAAEAALASAESAQRAVAAMLRHAEARSTAAERKRREVAATPPKPADAPKPPAEAKPAPPRLRTQSEIIAASPALELMELQRQRAAVKQDYGRFFQQRGLTLRQIEQFQTNWVKAAETRMDLAAAGRAQGEAGAHTVAALQAKAEADLEAAQRALLGPDGFEALEAYERTNGAYNMMVRGLAGHAAIEGIPLTPAQGESLLAAVVQASRGPLERGRIDLKTVDWDALDAQAQQILTPAQFALFRNVESPSGFRGRWTHQIEVAVLRAIAADAAQGPTR